MGCTPSNEVQQSPRKGTIRKGSIFKREKVSIKLGKNVGLSKTYPQVIFVFGGPGTYKGKLLADAADAFGLTLLNMEAILLEFLLSKMEEEEEIDPLKRSVGLQKFVRAQPELLRVDNVLKQLVKKVNSMDKNQCFLVDFMPNLKFVLQSTVFVKECSNELRNFENTFPVSFAVHLSIPPDKFVKKKKAESAQVQDNPKQNEAVKQSDEADTSRTSKRFLLNHNSLKHFLEYYNKHEKLVTIDVSSGEVDLVWERMCELFDDVMLAHKKSVNIHILFAFKESDLEEMAIGRFEMRVVSLSDLVSDPMDSPEKLLQSLRNHINQNPTEKSFAVILEGTSITKDMTMEKKKSILFMDVEKCTLEKHLSQWRKTNDKPVPAQSCSSVENEIYLFKPDVPSKFCIWMAEEMKKNNI